MFSDITFVGLIVGYFIYNFINIIGEIIVIKGTPNSQGYKDDMGMYADHFIAKTFKDPHLTPEIKGRIAVLVYGPYMFGTPTKKS